MNIKQLQFLLDVSRNKNIQKWGTFTPDSKYANFICMLDPYRLLYFMMQ